MKNTMLCCLIPGRTGFTKRLAAGALAFLLALSALLPACPGSAWAAAREYGPNYQRYLIDLPDNWAKNTRTGSDGTLTAVSPDKKSAFCISVCPREGRSVEALAYQAAGNLSVSSIVRRDDNSWVLYVTSENVRLRNILQRINESVLIISVLGENEKLDAILASLRPAAK